jgi:hypothetical protein
LATITAATIHILSSHPGGGEALITVGPGAIGFGATHLLVDDTTWANRLDSVDIDPSWVGGLTPENLQAIGIYVRNFGSVLESVAAGTMAGPALLTIFELYITVQWDDGTQQTWFPSYSAIVEPDASAGSIINQPSTAADGNPLTGVTISRIAFAPLADNNLVSLYYTSFTPPIIPFGGPHPYTLWSVTLPCIPCNPFR